MSGWNTGKTTVPLRNENAITDQQIEDSKERIGASENPPLWFIFSTEPV